MKSEGPQDPMPGMLADIDQATAHMPLLAKFVRGAYNAALGEDFSEAQAFKFALTLMTTTLGGGE